jgi:thiopurine S-methyltransferase
LTPEFWLQRWRHGRTGFHQAEVSVVLPRWWPSLKLATDARVLVPLCGKSLDVSWLCQRGGLLTAVDISPVAIEALCAEQGFAARRRSLPGFDLYETPALHLWCGDFLALDPAMTGPIDAIFDRAAFTSWPPAWRDRYVQQLDTLSAPGTQLLLVTLEYAAGAVDGPPFTTDAAEIERLFGARHAIERLDRTDILAAEPRWAARGLTALHEACYRLRRVH